MMVYLITPFFAWLIAGSSKFLVNTIKEKRLAFDLIGYGGMPSNHSSIVSSVVGIVYLKEGLDSPVLTVAIALAFIVILDASSLRKKIGEHATRINELFENGQHNKLRERVGHSKEEIIAGIVCGVVSSIIVYYLDSLFF